MAFRISRRSWVLGRPCPLGRGRWGSMHSHSASDRSVGYLFLMRARVAKHPPRTTFHTASLRTPVNRGRVPLYAPPSAALREEDSVPLRSDLRIAALRVSAGVRYEAKPE